MKKILMLFSLSWITFYIGFSQTWPNPCQALENALCGLDSLDGYELDMIPGELYFQTMEGCSGTWHNTSWFAFVAGATNVTIQITPSDCAGSSTGDEGLQAGVYQLYTENCNPNMQPFEWASMLETVPPISTTLNCSCSPMGPVLLTSTNFEVGGTYAVFIDGCNGSGCHIIIDTLQGGGTLGVVNVPNDLSFDAELFVSDTLCYGATNVILDVLDTFGAFGYVWEIDGQIDTTYDSEFLAPGPFDTSFQVCVTAFNQCAQSDRVCFDVLVWQPGTVIENDIICENDPYSWDVPVSNITSGQYSAVRNSALYGCTHDVILNLTVLKVNDDDPTIIDTAICAGEVFEIFPHSWTETIDPPEIFTIPTEETLGLVCDSFISLRLDVIDFVSYDVIDPWFDNGMFHAYFDIGAQPSDARIKYTWYNDAFQIESTNDTLITTECGLYGLEIEIEKSGVSCNYYVEQVYIDATDFVGTPCDDGNPDTQNDVIQEDCTCAGTLVGVENIDQDMAIEIFPNPFSESTIISLQDNLSKIEEITIYDLHGQKVSEIDVKPIQSKYHFNAQNLKAGVYFCQIRFDDRSLVERVVVLK